MSSPGIIRPARRPAGWIAPGPAPAGAQGRAELEPGPDEDLCFLCGDWRIFQPQRGHRYSLDDIVTAWVANGLGVAAPARVLDLGCGLGSVLLMVAWRHPLSEIVGIEAQADRAAMGRRAIDYNGCADRCRIVDGDLRDGLAGLGHFDLITGTPPYFPLGTGTTSELPHAEPCRFEVRGGVEEYLAAAVSVLAPGGHVVVCTSSLERARVGPAAAAAGLTVTEHWDIVPRAGKPVLVNVDVLRATAPGDTTLHTLTVRDEVGAWTPEFRKVRDDLGMPSTPPG